MKARLCSLFILLALLAGSHQATAQISFVLATNYPVGSGPYSLAAADVNSDGKVDLITANVNDNTLTVLTNNGGGGFVSSGTVNVGLFPHWVIAFTNTDGRRDLACANYGNGSTPNGSLSFVTNNGSGVLMTATNYGNSSGNIITPDSVVVADVNGGGRPDLICVNSDGSSLTILTNNGSGGFVTGGYYGTGSHPQSVTAADVNGDGKVDLIFANSGNNNITVLTNTGSGGFVQSGANYGVGSNPNSLVAFTNADGLVDLACANTGSNTLSLLTNNSSGMFTLVTNYTVGNGPVITAADINGDGKVDLMCNNTSDATVTVLTNTGSGGFAYALTMSYGGVGYCPVAVADVNGDGRPDLICANFFSNKVSVLLNTSTFPLTNLVVSPANPTIGVGSNQQFTATGYFSDGSSRVLTNASMAGSWTAVSGMSVAKSGSACATINGQLYVMSGPYADPSLLAYNPANNTWTTEASLPDDYGYAGAAGIGNKLYFIGGFRHSDGGQVLGELYIYDASANTWTSGATMPLPRGGMGVGVINGKIYVAGGYGLSGSYNSQSDLQVYDPASNTWTTGHAMPAPLAYCAATVLNGKFYVAGGLQNIYSAASTSGALYVYDPATDTWTTKSAMPTARAYLGMASLNGLLYAADGQPASNVATNLVEVYNPFTGIWSTGAPTLLGHFLSQPQAINGTIYLAGCSYQNTPITNVESFTPPSLFWNSGNPTVASVDTNGVATGVSPGVTAITATSDSVSGSTALTVGYNITQQPTNQVVTNSGTATFSVTVAGTGPFTYQWQLNGTNLPPLISTVVGNGSAGYSGDGGAATSAALNTPLGVEVDSVGDIFIVDENNQRIRKVDTNGIISTVAGNGSAGYSGDGGLATNAALHNPINVALDMQGNIFIADAYTQRIRKVDTNGIITTVAGNGSLGFSGDGGQATNAALLYPYGVTVDSFGNIIIADKNNSRVREVGTNGIITTVAGNGGLGYSGDGVAATNTSLYYPWGVAVDGAGNLLIGDSSNQRIRMVGTNGVITTVAGNGSAGYSGDGMAATNAYLYFPYDLALDSAGSIYIVDYDNNRIRKVATNGIITTVVGNGSADYSGDGGAATNASLNYPYGVALDSAGNLYIADASNNRIRKVSKNSPVLVLNNITTNSFGNYSVIITGPNGSVTSSVAVLNMPAYISQPPQPASVFGGNPMNLNVVAGGIGPFTYQWALNGTNLAGATNASYALAAAAGTNAGSYTVAVSNAYGGVVSAAANLAVHFVQRSPTGMSAWVGNAAGFSVTAGGVGPFSYQWAFNGTNIAGATNASYGISAVAVTNGGVYTVGVTNAYGGEVSAGAILSVDYLTQSPTNLVVTNGGTATFSVGVAGTGPFTYQWQLNGTNVPRVLTSSNGIISTVAGNGVQGYSGDGVAATNTSINYPYDVAVDGGGNVFIADTYNHRIRKIGTNGIITTVAGTGSGGYSGDGGMATNATFYYPQGMALDSAGNLFMTDDSYHIRKVATNGIITTVAGNGGGGYSGDGGAATNTSLYYPVDLAVDSVGNLFIADQDNQRIRKVATNGIITTVAGNGGGGYSGDGGAATNASLYYPWGVAVDSAGNIFIGDSNNRRIRKVGTNGIITTFAGGGNANPGDGGAATNAYLSYPTRITFDSAGNLLFVDSQRIRKVDASGIITTVAGGGNTYPGDGGLATSGQLNNAYGLALDSAGNLLIADTSGQRIRKVTLDLHALVLNYISTNSLGNYSVIITAPAGTFTSTVALLNISATITQPPQSQSVWAGNPATFNTAAAGSGALTYQWAFNGTNIAGATNTSYGISAVAVSNGGNYTVAVANNYGGITSSPAVLSVNYLTQGLTNVVTTNGGAVTLNVAVAGAGSFYYQWQLNGTNLSNLPRVLLSSSLITTVAGNGNSGFYGDGGAATNAALNNPLDLALDGAGNIYFDDSLNERVRMLGTNGIITTIAGNGSASYSGDGGAATNAALNNPYGVALDNAGNIFIADANNNRIRKVGTNGIITTLAGNGSAGYSGDGGPATSAALNSPLGVAVDGVGDIFIVDENNQRIRKVDTSGIITTVAGNGSAGYSGDGGAATNAALYNPINIALDLQGNIYIADAYTQRIRKVGTNGIITTVAGNGSLGFSGDGGPATNAALLYPYGVTVDNVGDIIIADKNNSRIREVGTNGVITTVAGNGSNGYTGDGVAATNTALYYPWGLAVDAAGNLLIGDSSNQRIRKISTSYQPMLTFTNVSAGNFGNYSVIITGPGGVFTNTASVTLPIAPRNFAAFKNPSGLQLQFAGSPGYLYVLQSATNLAPPVNWLPIFTNPADGNGNWSFTVTNLTRTSGCFYRTFRQ